MFPLERGIKLGSQLLVLCPFFEFMLNVLVQLAKNTKLINKSGRVTFVGQPGRKSCWCCRTHSLNSHECCGTNLVVSAQKSHCVPWDLLPASLCSIVDSENSMMSGAFLGSQQLQEIHRHMIILEGSVASVIQHPNK